ncbi:hypothetical protein JCM18920_2105 [Cutibacterium acnes JCM 18920]|nr:hypothetical protein JCM18920_2105 [Cutibacterium acnes JCM 18920]
MTGLLAGVGGVMYGRRGTTGDVMVRLNIGIIVTIVVLYLAAVSAMPWLVDKVSGRKSSRLPIRFALRDLNRNRGRAVPGSPLPWLSPCWHAPPSRSATVSPSRTRPNTSRSSETTLGFSLVNTMTGSGLRTIVLPGRSNGSLRFSGRT